MQDAISAVDALSRSVASSRTLQDTIDLNDQFVAVRGLFTVLIEDLISLTESFSAGRERNAVLQDAVVLVDSLTRTVDALRSAADALLLIDQLPAEGPRLRATSVDYDSDGAPLDATSVSLPFITH